MKDRTTVVALFLLYPLHPSHSKLSPTFLGEATPTHMLRICVNPLSAGVGNACTNLLGFLA